MGNVGGILPFYAECKSNKWSTSHRLIALLAQRRYVDQPRILPLATCDPGSEKRARHSVRLFTL